MTWALPRREAKKGGGEVARLVREGYSFGLPPFLVGIVLLAFGSGWVSWAGGVLVFVGLFVFSFFRNPERKIPLGVGVVVSPADGRVVVVRGEENGGQAGKRVSIFLAIWNVHVNRAPEAGTIRRIEYKKGKFLAAWDRNASFENEQNIFTQETEFGEIVYKQIAGWVARRVVSWKKAGDSVERGERIGLVRFGSRVDLWLPGEAEIAVRVGENVKGGSSVIARMGEMMNVRNAAGPERVSRTSTKLQEEPGS